VVNREGGGIADSYVTARIGKGWFCCVEEHLGFQKDQHEEKNHILNSNVKSVIHGCETWRTTNTMLLKIQHLSKAYLQYQMA
jgi:hypothetical protein